MRKHPPANSGKTCPDCGEQIKAIGSAWEGEPIDVLTSCGCESRPAE